MILSLLTLALAGPVDPARLAQEARVEQAAAAVAEARAEGRRRTEVAALMASFRVEADRLAAMAPPAEDEAAIHAAALAALTEATAAGRADPASRRTAEAWLGPIDARLTTLEAALAATATVRDPDLARTIAQDVEAQALAVMAVTAYDAAQAQEGARRARLEAAAYSAGDPRPGSPEAGERVRRALGEAEVQETARSAAWVLHERAEGLRARARQVAGEEP